MKTTYIIAIVVAVIIIIVGSIFAYTYLNSANSGNSQLAAATINGGGGTLIYPLMSSWIPAYAQDHSQITISYNPEGSGAGIKDFQNQIVNFGESDLPLQSSDISGLPSGTTALTIPISASAVVPAYNIPSGSGTITNGLNFTGSVLAQIFLGNITNWNDPQIAALNPEVTLPNHQIITVHRSDGSGTMYAFTDYLSQASSQWTSQVGKGKSVSWPNLQGAVAAKGNGGVAAAIIQNQYSIGPLEIAYEITNAGQISYGKVQNAAGNFILANVTAKNVQDALSAGASTGLPAGNNATGWSSFSIIDNIFTNTTATNAYPITTLTYALVYQAQTDHAVGAALVNFLSWIVNNGQSFGPILGYAPLPANIVAIDNATLKLITYNGTPIQS